MFRAISLSGLMVFAACMTTDAQGALLQGHDPAITGTGYFPVQDGWNITYDTETGLSWLDLTLSRYLSYNSVLNEIGPGGLFEGFSLAEPDDLTTLFTHASLTIGYSAPPDPHVPSFQNLVGYGDAFSGGDPVRSSSGWYDCTATQTDYPGASIVLQSFGDPNYTIVTISCGWSDFDTPYWGRGACLYRSGAPPQMIPEPSSFTIFGILIAGGLGMWWLGKRRKANARIG